MKMTNPPGYYSDESMLRQVHREMVVALSGPRALLMQAAHPVAVAGFLLTTDALDDPYGRLGRTAQVLNTITWGTREQADEITAVIRRVHATKSGTLPEAVGKFPAGTTWAADAPDLLLWIVGTLADSALLVYQRYVRRLKRAEKDAYWQDMRQFGELFGLTGDEMPATSSEFEAYMREMVSSDVLHVSDRARELGIQIVLHPPVPVWALPLRELVDQITIGMLPSEIRRQYGLSWDPARALALRAGQEYARRFLMPLIPGQYRYNHRRPAAS